MTEVTNAPAKTPLKRLDVIRSNTRFSADPAMRFRPSVNMSNPNKCRESPASSVISGVIQMKDSMRMGKLPADRRGEFVGYYSSVSSSNVYDSDECDNSKVTLP